MLFLIVTLTPISNIPMPIFGVHHGHDGLPTNNTGISCKLFFPRSMCQPCVKHPILSLFLCASDSTQWLATAIAQKAPDVNRSLFTARTVSSVATNTKQRLVRIHSILRNLDQGKEHSQARGQDLLCSVEVKSDPHSSVTRRIGGSEVGGGD